MSQALTLTEAAERLAPVFEEAPSSLPVEARPSKGKWMSLDHAAAVLADRVTGKPAVAPKKRTEAVSVREAAKQIERPGELAEIRVERTLATITKEQRYQEWQDFLSRAMLPFEGMEESAAVSSPEFMVVYGCVKQLQEAYEVALRAEFDLWDSECKAENAVFESGRPDWTHANASKVVAMLRELGVTEQELFQLWMTPHPINVASPVCSALAAMVVGADNPDPINAALGAVGFDDDEISDVVSGKAPIILRDHRIQELTARASDAYTPAENRAAA